MADERLTHLDEHGRARMVDVSEKPLTMRRAVAEGWLRLSPLTLEAIGAGILAKGDVVAVARLAGIQAAKRTADWIPLCHPLHLDAVRVDVEAAPPDRLHLRAEVAARDRTGVEMEALCAVAAAGLAAYDMVKAIDRGASLEGVRLLRKEGGRTGTWERGG